MNKDVFLAQLAEVLQVNKEELNEEFELNADNWDSVAHLSVIALIDEQFGMTVPSNELIECKSVGALLKLVQSNLTPAPLGSEG